MFLDYAQCTNSIRKTCDARGTKQSVTSFSDCSKACDEDDYCKFIFHNPAGVVPGNGLPCVIYETCEMFKDTKGAVGSIYSKDGNCPGNIFAFNNLPVLVIQMKRFIQDDDMIKCSIIWQLFAVQTNSRAIVKNVYRRQDSVITVMIVETTAMN